MKIKMKCYNKELGKWDECSYPIFKGLNPVEVIGFQDENGNEQLIENGNAVKLFTGSHDRYNKEIYDGDVLKSPYNNGMLFVTLSVGSNWVLLPYNKEAIASGVPVSLKYFASEFHLIGKNICEVSK